MRISLEVDDLEQLADRLAERVAQKLESRGAGAAGDGGGYEDTSALARRYNASPRTLAAWCREGRLPAIRIGRSWRARPQDVEAALRAPASAGGEVLDLRARAAELLARGGRKRGA